VIIVGAGGFGREVYEYALDADGVVEGFLDDNPEALSAFDGFPPVLGAVTDADPRRGPYVIAVGDPCLRARWAEELTAAGCQLATLVHPTATVARSAVLGPGVVVAPGVVIGACARIDANVMANVNAAIGHDSRIGAHSVLAPFVAVNGWATVGEEVFMGSQSVVTLGVKIGAHSKVSAGAVATQDCDPGSLLVGNPAKGRVIYTPEPCAD
jgi:sugar O-acyltransferase (sialic acid O-acetyltransferase NeuD family)